VRRGAYLLLVLSTWGCAGSAQQPDAPRRELAWQPVADGIGRCGLGACTGCCQAGTCVTPSTNTACGVNGGGCVNCTASGRICVDGACQQLDDAFDGTGIDDARWGVTTGGGATVGVTGGELVLDVPAVANAYAEVFSRLGFSAGSVLEARVYMSAAQFYDHRGIGFSDRRVGADCNDAAGESEAAQWRAQDEARVAESKVGSRADCDVLSPSYPSGYRTIKIVRDPARTLFYEDGALIKENSTPAQISSARLSVRFSAFTYYAAGPSVPITIRVDWVKVSSR
jgi:hypothetical protein